MWSWYFGPKQAFSNSYALIQTFRINEFALHNQPNLHTPQGAKNNEGPVSRYALIEASSSMRKPARTRATSSPGS